MSIHSHDHQTQANGNGNMPPFPTDETVVVPPPEHRDDKGEKKNLWIKIGLGAAGIAAVVGAAVGIKSGGSTNSESPAPTPDKTASAPAATATEVTPSPTQSETAPLQLSPVVLSAEDRLLWDSSRFEQDRLSIPMLDNMQGVIKEIIEKGVDYDDIDFSSVTENNESKAELRGIARTILEGASDTTDVKFCLPGDEYEETSGTEKCGTFISTITGDHLVPTIRIYTESDPLAELSEHTVLYDMGSRLNISEDNVLSLEKDPS